jgi:hypothetical protein
MIRTAKLIVQSAGDIIFCYYVAAQQFVVLGINQWTVGGN